MKVSVLVACYNAEHWIQQSLASIINQTYADIEVIVVDDCSTDGSAAIVAMAKDSRIRLIRQSHNQGASAARNKAFAVSKGEFIIFVDADDFIAPTHIESLVNRLLDEPTCVALSKWARFHRDPSEASFIDRPTEQDLNGCDWLVMDWTGGQPMTQSGMILIPRRLIKQHGGWDERLTLIDDFEFFARIISKSGGVRYAPGARLHYRSGIAGSLSTQRSRAAVISQLTALTLGTQHLLAVRNDAKARAACAGLLQAFEYEHYPEHPDLREQARARVNELGGSKIEPEGPPGFHALRRFVGWRLARRVQRFAAARRTNRLAQNTRITPS